ncbi:phosphoserine phosphatase, chloroplastic-like isoform X3 [Hevea brasiliensis]|uniref:phosphoserine phosphatase, chloroplastic-like isoform X3 n=1 Tax=Hevea brasiliensis TaxID=3981 RepID=UPI0025E93EB1|nr:phosphoserine phosphatase, chloroplastic-like isoform X3 [Hevea brasiliensis]
MEGLVHLRIDPIHPTCRHSGSRFIPAFPLQLKKDLNRDVLGLWRSADAVCFDIDSTVCLDEGIDELAEFCGARKAVAEWTAKAMGGSVPFEEALAAILSLFKPSLSQVQDFLEKRPPK